MKKRTGSFSARDDNGRQYTIHIYTEYTNAGSRDDPHAVLEGPKELVLSDGSHVNRRDKGIYEIVGTGVTLRSDSPDAP